MTATTTTTLTSAPISDHRLFTFLRDVRRDRDPRLSPAAKLVLHELVDKTDRRGGVICDPSGAALAQDCGVSRAQLFRLVGQLRARGLIRVESRAKRKLSAIYVINWDCYGQPVPERADKPVRVPRVQPRRGRASHLLAPAQKQKVERIEAKPAPSPEPAAVVDLPPVAVESKADATIFQAVMRKHGLGLYHQFKADAPELHREAVASEVAEPGTGYAVVQRWNWSRQSSAVMVAAE